MTIYKIVNHKTKTSKSFRGLTLGDAVSAAKNSGFLRKNAAAHTYTVQSQKKVPDADRISTRDKNNKPKKALNDTSRLYVLEHTVQQLNDKAADADRRLKYAEAKVETLQRERESQEDKHDVLKRRVSTLEARVGWIVEQQHSLLERVDDLSTRLFALEARMGGVVTQQNRMLEKLELSMCGEPIDRTGQEDKTEKSLSSSSNGPTTTRRIIDLLQEAEKLVVEEYYK